MKGLFREYPGATPEPWSSSQLSPPRVELQTKAEQMPLSRIKPNCLYTWNGMGAQEKGERGNEAAGAGGIKKGWDVDVREQSKSGVMHELTKGQLL